MDHVTEYSPAIISLLVFVLIVLFQGAFVAAGKTKAGLAPGNTPKDDYGDSLYRLNRSHQNGLEIMASAAVAVFACILAGASAWWVNLLTGLFLLTRIAYLFVYTRNIGKPSRSVRSFVFVAGWAMLVALCIMAIWKLA
jgi:uncharacterized MAPEG superfamily protein